MTTIEEIRERLTKDTTRLHTMNDARGTSKRVRALISHIEQLTGDVLDIVTRLERRVEALEKPAPLPDEIEREFNRVMNALSFEAPGTVVDDVARRMRVLFEQIRKEAKSVRD